MARLLPPEPKSLSPEQRRAYDANAAGLRAGVSGPFVALMHAPELAGRIHYLGHYIHFGTLFPPRLSEFALLIVARHYTCQYQWQAHESRAPQSGLAQSIIDAIKEKRRPEAMQPDESAVFDFTTELLRGGKVSDAVYERALKTFGTQGVVELGALVGYYTMIAMTLLAHEVPLPPGKAPPLRA